MTTQLAVFIFKLNDWDTIHVSNFKFVSSFNYKTALTSSIFFPLLGEYEKPQKRETAEKFPHNHRMWSGGWEKGRDLWEIWNMVIGADDEYDDIRVFFFLFLFFDLNNTKTIINHTIFISTCLRGKLWEIEKNYRFTIPSLAIRYMSKLR